ncbi:MAG: hypothetical protein QM723_11745 [Myxococcaceae bacterium]
MLSEEQIQLYARQILLKPVGGRGQEKLCSAKAVVIGDGLAAQVAKMYLKAGGTILEASEGPGVVVGAEVHWSDCSDCLSKAAGANTPAPDDTAVLAGTLAALVFQRITLGLGARDGRLRVHPDGTFEPIAPLRCEGHR